MGKRSRSQLPFCPRARSSHFRSLCGVAPQTPIEHKTVMKKVNWLIEKDIYDRESKLLAALQKQGYIYQETKNLNFRKEWRFFLKNQIFTGSLYLVGEERVDETIRGGYLENYLSEVFKEVSWYPESVYTIDICESEGELYVLELGSFSCAGEYACDLSAIVDFGAKAAWEDYEAVNQF